MFNLDSDPAYAQYAAERPEMMAALLRYGRDHEGVGHFLTAVFENNLMKAMSQADLSNRRWLHTICLFVYNEMPSTCHGSPEKVKAWLEQKGQAKP